MVVPKTFLVLDQFNSKTEVADHQTPQIWEKPQNSYFYIIYFSAYTAFLCIIGIYIMPWAEMLSR